MLLQQADVLSFGVQQCHRDDRYGRQYDQRQAQAEDGLVTKTYHNNFFILIAPYPNVADSATGSEARQT